MNFEETKVLINKIIENEFYHISEYRESEDLNKIEEVVEADKCLDISMSKLFEVVPREYCELVQDTLLANDGYWMSVARYYFKEGVRAGTTNLSFLKDTNIIDYL